MALGILEDDVLEHVPGTSYVYVNENRAPEDARRGSHLKLDKTGKMILVPQPSDDPNDPLNWPLWKRDLILFILSFVSVISATTSPLLAANTLTLSLYFRRSFTKAALLTGYHLCGVGVAGFLFVPSARVWGKRHLFLLGNILMVISSAWGGGSKKNYQSLLWARIFQGIALAPFEALVNASVGDLYYVHERGKRMALSNVALFGGAFLTPVFVGKITHTLGWWWTFYFIAIFAGAAFPLMFFFVPETAYRRASYLDTDMGEKEEIHQKAGNDLSFQESKIVPRETAKGSDDKGISTDEQRLTTDQANHHPQTKSRWSPTLMPFNGRKTDDSFWKLLLRPIPLFSHPAILWACLIQGVIIGWTVMIGVVLAAIFLGPPLWFNEVQTGYMYTGAFVGSIVGLILSGLLADVINKLMIRLNDGKYEPEFRILLVLPQLVFSSIGLYGFGITSSNVDRYGWLIPDVFLMFVIMGMVMGAVASALYVVDAHRQLAVEAFTCMLIFKNIFSFILTYFAYDWLKGGGVERTFNIIASIQVGICLLSVPMYVLGKRNRSFFHRHDLLVLTHLQ